LKTIIQYINKWFLDKRIHFESFALNDTRVESWFKAELLVLFEKLKSQSLIDNYEREANLRIGHNRKQIDFKIKINGIEHLCELKAMCISQAMGTPRNLKFYFKEDAVGLIKDFKKLDQFQNKNTWVLAFVYPKPSESDWREAINSLSNNVRHWHCVTSIRDYPEYLFIALWQKTGT
jgi:hypothetical protein